LRNGLVVALCELVAWGYAVISHNDCSYQPLWLGQSGRFHRLGWPLHLKHSDHITAHVQLIINSAPREIIWSRLSARVYLVVDWRSGGREQSGNS
jgi:hypothetical protein